MSDASDLVQTMTHQPLIDYYRVQRPAGPCRGVRDCDGTLRFMYSWPARPGREAGLRMRCNQCKRQITLRLPEGLPEPEGDLKAIEVIQC